jgi:hypothetical protein
MITILMEISRKMDTHGTLNSISNTGLFLQSPKKYAIEQNTRKKFK